MSVSVAMVSVALGLKQAFWAGLAFTLTRIFTAAVVTAVSKKNASISQQPCTDEVGL